MIKYPAQIDDSASLPATVDNNTPVQADVVNKLRNAILAVESELGVKPSGIYSTVRARLDAMDTLIGTFDFIKLKGDLGGTTSIPLVIGIQGNPISDQSPNLLDVLMWNGISWTPMSVGAAGITISGDLSGDTTTQQVVGLQSRPLDSAAPTIGQALIWDGTKWSPGNVSAGTVFTATLAGGGIVEVSQTIANPAFTATYTATPDLATLSDTDGNSQDVTATPTSFNSIYSFVKNTFGATVTFTLMATKDAVTESPTATLSWGQKAYWGVGPAGLVGNTFITTYSTGNATALTRSTTFSVTAGASDKIYFACRSGYGSGTAVFTVGGFEGGFTFVGTFSRTNTYGFIENYDLYESDNVGLGATTVTVS